MSISQQQKKARERAAIDAFRNAYDKFPSGDILEDEKPDFIVGTSGIGIELREYFREELIDGSPVQEQEALRRQITNRASDGCAAATDIPNVFAMVFFNRSERLSKRDVIPISEVIVASIRANLPTNASSRKITNGGQLPPSIESMIYYYPGNLKEPCVTTTDAVWVREIANQEMQNILDAKEKRLASYRQRCSEIWLLIVVNGFRISSMAKLPSSFQQLVSSFDRVFILHNNRSVVELSVAG
jgi:hypothetical protein